MNENYNFPFKINILFYHLTLWRKNITHTLFYSIYTSWNWEMNRIYPKSEAYAIRIINRNINHSKVGDLYYYLKCIWQSLTFRRLHARTCHDQRWPLFATLWSFHTSAYTFKLVRCKIIQFFYLFCRILPMQPENDSSGARLPPIGFEGHGPAPSVLPPIGFAAARPDNPPPIGNSFFCCDPRIARCV